MVEVLLCAVEFGGGLEVREARGAEGEVGGVGVVVVGGGFCGLRISYLRPWCYE